MKFAQKLDRRLTLNPYLIITLCVALGIVAESLVSIPLWLPLVVVPVCGTIAFWGKSKMAQGAMLVAFGAAIALLNNNDSAMKWESKLHEFAIEKMEKLELADSERGVIYAMGVGSKLYLDTEQQQSYSESGYAHVLAVSGLHVGVVCVIVNILLMWLTLIPFGHAWRNIFVIICIWIYAAACGGSPSVLRAAVMISIMQLSIASSRHYSSINALCAAALLTLCVNPAALFNIGFQLSYVAVIAIIVWTRPIMRAFATRNVIVDYIVGGVVVSLIATVASAPIISHYFGVISVVGITTFPLILLYVYAIVVITILYLLSPFSCFVEPVSAILTTITSSMNQLALSASRLPYGHFDVKLSSGEVAIFYVIATILTFCVWVATYRSPDPRDNRISKLPSSLLD